MKDWSAGSVFWETAKDQKQRDALGCHGRTHRHTHRHREAESIACLSCSRVERSCTSEIRCDGRSVGIQGWGNETSAESSNGVGGWHGLGGAETKEGAGLFAYQWDHQQLRGSGGEAAEAGVEAIPGRRRCSSAPATSVSQELLHPGPHLLTTQLRQLQDHAHVRHCCQEPKRLRGARCRLNGILLLQQ